MAGIEEKLGKSLDDLIKEQQGAGRGFQRSNGGARRDGGPKRDQGSRKPGKFQRNTPRGDAMEVDTEDVPERGRGRPLGVKGGVRKQGQARSATWPAWCSAKTAPQEAEVAPYGLM
jgi:hypothetical protein